MQTIETPALLLDLAREARTDGCYETAIGHYRELIEVKANDDQLLLELADTYRLSGAPDESLAVLNDFSPGDGLFVKATLLKGMVYLPHAPAKAFAYFKEAARASPYGIEARLLVGEAYRVMQEFARAKTVFENILQQHQNSALANYYLGRLLNEMGGKHLALSFLFRALQLTPSFAPAKEIITEILVFSPDIDLKVFSETDLRTINDFFANEKVNYQNLSMALYPLLGNCLETCNNKENNYPENASFLLLNSILRNTVIIHLGIEEQLKMQRKFILSEIAKENWGVLNNHQAKELCLSLAIHSFTNGYLWAIDDAEKQGLEKLGKLLAGNDCNPKETGLVLLVMAMYEGCSCAMMY